MSKKDKTYSNGEITVYWKPEVCEHSAVCARTLPEVFKPLSKPWVKIENASSDEIMDAIDRCPSGALSYRRNNDV